MIALPKFCLVMIVKNEAAIMERCLRSVAAVGVTHYSIADTGSTDGTPEVIRRVAEELGMTGEVHHVAWESFGQARTEAYRLARGKAEWLITLDADHVLEGSLDNFAAACEAAPHVDIWLCWRVIAENGRRFRTSTIVRGDLEWHYLSPEMHEVLDHCGRRQGFFDDLTEVVYFDGARHRNLRKHRDDALVIERTMGRGDARYQLWRLLVALLLLVAPGSAARRWAEESMVTRLLTVGGTTRQLFYAGQTWAADGNWGRAARFYAARFMAGDGGMPEERWNAAMMLGACQLSQNENPLAWWLTAYETRPGRNEPVILAAEWMIRQRMFHSAYALLMGCELAEVPPVTDILLIQPECYSWKPITLLAAACAGTDRGEAAKLLLEGALAKDDLPLDGRVAIEEVLANTAKEGDLVEITVKA